MFTTTEISNEDMAKLKVELPDAQIAWTRPKPDQIEKLKAEIAKQKK